MATKRLADLSDKVTEWRRTVSMEEGRVEQGEQLTEIGELGGLPCVACE